MSDCGCIFLDGSDGEVASYLRSKKVMAHIDHTCSECKGAILSGIVYEHTEACWHGKWETFKICPICLDIHRVFFCEGFIYGTMVDDVKAHIEDMGGDISSECLMELTEPARRRVIKMIEECWNASDQSS